MKRETECLCPPRWQADAASDPGDREKSWFHRYLDGITDRFDPRMKEGRHLCDGGVFFVRKNKFLFTET